MSKDQGGVEAPIEIKKYANRRLYNTATSSYVTLDHLCAMVKNGQEFIVRDAKTGEDITHSVLTQIIFEQENKGHYLLPISFLRNLIMLYDDNINQLVPNYLDITMSAFANQQDELRHKMDTALGEFFPVAQMEEMGRRNMEMFQNAMSMMNPFLHAKAGTNAKPADNDENASEKNLDSLRKQMAEMQEQLDRLASKS